MSSIQTLLQQAQTYLPHSDSARLDITLLLCHILEKPQSYLYTHPEKILTDHENKQLRIQLHRRQCGEPIAYIIGHWEAYALGLLITPHVLVPRPETDLLIEHVLQMLPHTQQQVLDLGTGPGTIALNLAHARPRWQITATDVSADALAVAKQNAQRHELHNIHFYLGSWFDALPKQQYHIIISNPPYIADNDPLLTTDPLCFEPYNALASGTDGLNALRHIIAQAPHYLRPQGYLFLEHGYQQGPTVQKLMKNAGFHALQTQQDLATHPRFTFGQYLIC